jgi:hypothetical protein
VRKSLEILCELSIHFVHSQKNIFDRVHFLGGGFFINHATDCPIQENAKIVLKSNGNCESQGLN